MTNHSDIDIIILDRFMPVMDGLEFMHKLKSFDDYRDIPIIMQTAADSDVQIMEGIAAGAFYYITKPYNQEILLAVVKSALESNRRMEAIHSKFDRLFKQNRAVRFGMRQLDYCGFSFNSISQARAIASIIASCFPQPREVILGFIELMTNAVEHGNLGITYENKIKLRLEDSWEDEIAFRLNQPENRNKMVKVELERDDKSVSVIIKDEGNGFDWEKFTELDAARALSPNGRGIYLASLDFDRVEFLGNGNTVKCIKNLDC